MLLLSETIDSLGVLRPLCAEVISTLESTSLWQGSRPLSSGLYPMGPMLQMEGSDISLVWLFNILDDVESDVPTSWKSGYHLPKSTLPLCGHSQVQIMLLWGLESSPLVPVRRDCRNLVAI